MSKKNRNKHKHMKGGFLDYLSNSLTGLGSSFSQSASSMWEKTKNATTGLTPSATPTSTLPNTTASSPTQTTTISTSPQTTISPNPTTTQNPNITSTYGGRRSKRIRGGFKDNDSTTGIASNAAPFSGPTAKPQTIVGGKTKKRGRTKKGIKTKTRSKKGGFFTGVFEQAIVPVSIFSLQQKYKKPRKNKTHRKH